MRCGTWLVMASTRSWCAGVHHLDIGAQRLPEGAQPVDGRRVGAVRRRQDAPAVVEQRRRSRRRGRNARCRPPGCAGHEVHARRADAAAPARRPAPLTEPTSETMAPGFSAGAIWLGDGAAGADRHAEDDEVGAARRPRRRRRGPRRRCPARDARRATSADASAATMRARHALAPAQARQRRADQAEADDGDALEEGLRQCGPSRQAPACRHEVGERRDDEAVGLLAADRSGAARSGRP